MAWVGVGTPWADDAGSGTRRRNHSGQRHLGVHARPAAGSCPVEPGRTRTCAHARSRTCPVAWSWPQRAWKACECALAKPGSVRPRRRMVSAGIEGACGTMDDGGEAVVFGFDQDVTDKPWPGASQSAASAGRYRGRTGRAVTGGPDGRPVTGGPGWNPAARRGLADRRGRGRRVESPVGVLRASARYRWVADEQHGRRSRRPGRRSCRLRWAARRGNPAAASVRRSGPAGPRRNAQPECTTPDARLA